MERASKYSLQVFAQIGTFFTKRRKLVRGLPTQHLFHGRPRERRPSEQRKTSDCRQAVEIGALVNSFSQKLFRTRKHRGS